jgi:outer membrane protein assembly factor BamB
MALRFVLDSQRTLAVYFSQPDMKFYDLGPSPVEQHGDTLSAPPFVFHLSSDKRTISGTAASDGNVMTFELAPGVAPVEAPAPDPEGRVAHPAWTFQTGGAIWSSPSVDDGFVYFGSNDSTLYALHADRGAVAWHTRTGGRVIGQPTVVGPALYVLSDDGLLYKLAKQTGRIEWTFDTHGGAVIRHLPKTSDSVSLDFLTSAPTVGGGVVYVGSRDKRLYAVDATSGRERWHFETGDIVCSTAALAGGRVFFGSQDHYVYALDAATGALAWKFDTHRDVVSSPLVDHGAVYIGSRSANLYALDAASGAVRWTVYYWTSFVESSARIRDGVLYVGSSDYQKLLALDPATGRQRWSFDTDGSSWSTPAVTDQMVYIGAVGLSYKDYMVHHGAFFAVDRATGRAVWRFPMPVLASQLTYGVAVSPATDGRFVYFGALDGTFYAFPK